MQDAHFSSLAPDLASGAIELEDVDLASTSILDPRSAPVHAPSRPIRAPRWRDAERDPPVAMPKTIAGYEILDLLGRGGMGTVYCARLPTTGERIALKTANAHFPGAAASLLRESSALERLSHRGIVRLRTISESNGVPFYTMDLVHGPHLGRLTSSHFAESQPTPHGRTRLLTILLRIASTLVDMHAAGVAHGDLSPSNILVRRADDPVLVDFGLSTIFAHQTRRTRPNFCTHAMGTLAYMSPEQIRKERFDGRADFYAWGCLLYEALTGRPPFTGRHRSTVLRQHLEATPCPPSLHTAGISAALDALTLGLLAKKPQQRAAHVAEIDVILRQGGARDWPAAHRRAAQSGFAQGRSCA